MNLALKYRPKTFSDVVNQKHVVVTLQNALKTLNIGNAYMLTGPRGIGKTTLARLFAKGLNCEKGVTEDPCGVCENCREIDESRNVDVLEIDGASNRGIDQIRELRENVRFTPLKGRYKVIIIDEVHMLTTEAFNALLKTLEEPPKNVVFIFATTEPNKVLDTVKSRTLRFDLRPLEKHHIIERLKKIANLENIGYESDDVLDLIAEASTGGLRDAISLLEQAYIYSQGTITLEKAKELTGILPQEIYYEILSLILEKNSKEIVEIIEKVVAYGYSLEDFHKSFVRAAESLLKAHYRIENNLFSPLASKFTEYQILFLLRVLKDMELDLKGLSNPKIFVDFHLLRLSKIESELELLPTVNFINSSTPQLNNNNGSQKIARGLSEASQLESNTANGESNSKDIRQYMIEKLKLKEDGDGPF
ncbi:MAG TPA: DNA polymerase III subunit gamma/tau [Candidatus Hydrothermia bacterium]|nr:DNA polymerase III subunit gamma/tau [Candidatus Hydrothermae bacterium]HOP33176.1 DNA polymerase III subunit gamma/tau [Candidatus Hydrothermia bacterium]HRD23487.1 DNA polymerase III subunit gamma/tau [Candidatus Hydrothermia bacterium]